MLALRSLRERREKKMKNRKNDWQNSRKRENENYRGIRKEKPNELLKKQKQRGRGRKEIASMQPCMAWMMVLSTKQSLLSSHLGVPQQMPQREEP